VNLGTFLVHRWAREGNDRARIDEVKSARDHIAKAIEINPNAHFGREKYQLKALEWIIEPPSVEPYKSLPNLLGIEDRSAVAPKDADDAVRGLAGLVVLGNAWESVDVFNALAIALHYDTLGFSNSSEGGRNSLSYLSSRRCAELIHSGKISMLPGAPHGDALEGNIFWTDFMPEQDLKSAYPKLRAEADAWQAARAQFMTARLENGRHPDTDPGFWDGYTEHPPPSLPTVRTHAVAEARAALREQVIVAIVGGGVVLLAGVLAGSWLVRLIKDRRKTPLPEM
jgi:hypothetical protein